MNQTQRFELVFIPTPTAGHLLPTLNFFTRFIDRDPRFSATILLSALPAEPDPLDTLLARKPHFHTDRIRYLRLPPVDPPPPELFSISLEKLASEMAERYKPHVRTAIIDHVLSATNAPPLAALVLDLFFTSMIDVGQEFGVPSYIFSTFSAAFLGFMFYLETRHRRVSVEFEESDAESIIPSFTHPVPAEILPSFVFNKKGGYSAMVKHAQKLNEAKGIIINTFPELEPYAVSSLAGTLPIYTVGPVLDLKGELRPPSDENRYRKIMKWLDNQPVSSVVFLCFGSRGSLSSPQVEEIAKGLEKSEVRFLWCLRRPPKAGEVELPSDYGDCEDVLPEGFAERVKGKGVICGWVPQVEVLAHEAVGGFVSHCGWSSVLESVGHGVPLVTWPLYAEQRMNAFELVRELGVAVEMKMDYGRVSGEVVSAEEIERAVRCVMKDDSEVRKKMKMISEMSKKVISEGGSSYLSLGNLIEDMVANLS